MQYAVAEEILANTPLRDAAWQHCIEIVLSFWAENLRALEDGRANIHAATCAVEAWLPQFGMDIRRAIDGSVSAEALEFFRTHHLRREEQRRRDAEIFRDAMMSRPSLIESPTGRSRHETPMSYDRLFEISSGHSWPVNSLSGPFTVGVEMRALTSRDEFARALRDGTWADALGGGDGYTNHDTFRVPDARGRAPHPFTVAGSPQAAAEKKARETLMLYLTPQQQESFKQNSFFDVDVKGGGRIRLKPTRAYNAELLESNAWGKRGTRFCAVPSNNHELPICDQLLIQKLW